MIFQYYSKSFYNKGLEIKKILSFVTILLTFSACSFNQPKLVSSATILIKTPKIKFYDRGFVSIYKNYTQVQVLSAGVVVLNLKMYKDRVCKDSFECQNYKDFNKEFLSSEYKEKFIKELFEKNEKNIVFRDKSRDILIKIVKD